jgi:uncharacterized protein
MMLTFDWDTIKARQNLAKHGISFERASRVFFDPFALELLDTRADYGEERMITIGLTEAGILTVISTERGPVLRIISARLATKEESRAYAQHRRFHDPHG